MTKIKLTCSAGSAERSYVAGETIDLPAKEAEAYIAAGLGEAVSSKPKAPAKRKPAAKKK